MSNTDTNEKFRAVLLAALMVLSVVAMTVSFAGSAAAAVVSPDDVTLDDATVNEGDAVSGEVNVTGGNSTDIQVWIDTDGDGSQDPGEPNVTVSNTTFDSVSNTQVPFSGLDTTGLSTGDYTVAVNQTNVTSPTSDTNNATVTVQQVIVTDVDAPRVAPNQTEITVEVTVEHVGVSAANNTDVVLGADNASGNVDTGGPSVNINRNNNNSLAPGESQTFTFTPNTGSDYVANGIDTAVDTFHGAYLEDNSTSAFLTGEEQRFYIGGSNTSGAVSVEVRDTDGFPVEDATVTLYIGSKDPANVVASGAADGGPDSNRIRFEDLAIGTDSDNTTEYIAVAEKENFASDSRSAELHENNIEQTLFPELESTLDAQAIEVVQWDTANNEPILTDEGTLLANGESSNKLTFAVITQNQLNESIDGSLDVDLAWANDAGGDQIGDFVDNDLLNRTHEVTITGTDTATLDEAHGDLNPGTVSYVTFEVTADNATAERLQDLGIDPIGSNSFDATATNETTTLSDNATVNYVLEGDDVITGEVRDADGGLEDVTVWAGYGAQSNRSLAFTEDTFVNDISGDTFLVDVSVEDGDFTIDGLALPAINDTHVDVTNASTIHLYAVVEDNTLYNRINRSGNAADQYVAAHYTIEPEEWEDQGAHFQVDQEIFVSQEELDFEYRMDVTVENVDGDQAKDVDVAQGQTRDVVVEVERKPISRDTDWQPAEDGQEVTINLTDTSKGDLAENVLTVEDGQVTTTFTAAQAVSGSTNVTAETQNDLGDTNSTSGSDEARINVFGAAAITGDVVNEDSENLPGATVRMYDINDSDLSDPLAIGAGGETFIEAGDFGSYTISEIDGVRLQSGESYIVEATFDGESETRTFNNLQAGTNDGDIAIIGVSPEAATFEVSDVDVSPSSAEAGDTVTVTATVTNTGDELGTKDVTLERDGSTVDTESNVELSGGDNTNVSFEVDTTGFSEGNHTLTVSTTDDSGSTTLTISSNGDLSRFDTNDDGTIGLDETLAAIDAFNNDEDVGGQAVDLDDVLAVIEAFNEQTAV